MPSSTETLAALGLADRVVGRTRYCVRPRPWVDGVAAVGGTKDPDLKAIAALRPDLIVVNDEENRADQFPALQAIAPLWRAFPRDVDAALADVARLGEALGEAAAADRLLERLRAGRAAALAAAAGRPPWRYVCLVWRRPWRAAGPDTFASALLAELGGVNVAPEAPGRYPALSLDALRAARPDVVLLPSEPWVFRAEHAAELEELAPRARLVDGELLFWHGARLEHAWAWLAGRPLP